jgi:hypothetical protein
VNSVLVNWQSWSELKIFGLRKRESLRPELPSRKALSKVNDTFQAKT